MTKSAPKILCAGIAVQDIIMRVENFPAPGAKVSASEFIVTGGGCAANAAVAIARLGGHAAFAGPLGDDNDHVSKRIVGDLNAEGIDCSGTVRVDGGAASVSLILLDALGEKTIATRRGVKLSNVLPADEHGLVADADAVLVDNRFPEFVGAVCRAAVKRNIPVVIDLDQATKVDHPLLALGTYVVASSEALRGTTGIDDLGAGLKRLAEHLTGFLAVTDGPDGIYWLDSGEIRHMAAFKVDAIDTLGAGDAFHGAFAFRLVETGDVIASMRFAAAAAAIKCTRFGGLKGAPTRTEIDEFLKRQPS